MRLVRIFSLSILTVILFSGFAVVPSIRVEAQSSVVQYDRAAAIAWALSHNRNDGIAYGNSEGRYCTTFVAGALHAGGLNVPTTLIGNGGLVRWMLDNPNKWDIVSSPADLMPGDFIFYSRLSYAPSRWSEIDSNGYSNWGHSALYMGNGLVSAWNSERLNVPVNWYTSQPYHLYVHIRTEPPTPRQTDLSWDFSQGVPQGWAAVNDLTGVKQLDGGMWAQMTDRDPIYYSPMTVPFMADDFDRLRFTISTQSAQCIEFFWRGPGQSFSADRRILYNLSSRNGTFTIQLSDYDSWTGVIDQLRFDPACRWADGQPNAVRVNLIELLRSDGSSLIPHINWDFGLSVPQSWDPANALRGVKQLDGGMWAEVTGGDPVYLSPIMEPFPASEFDELFFTMSTRENQCIQLYWRGPNQSFSEGRSKQFNIRRNGEYSMSLTEADNWRGMIEQIRFDPICRLEPDGDPTSNGIRINTIQLRQANDAPPEQFEIVLDPTMSIIGLGGQTTISALILNPDLAPTGGIRALDVACNVDNPSILSGVLLMVEDAFPPEAVNVTLPDPDFNPAPNFQWLVSIPAPIAAVTEDGIAFSVTYQGIAGGIANISCAIEALDQNDNIIVNIPVNTVTIEVAGNGSIAGIATLEHGTDYSNIGITLYDAIGNPVANATTDITGNFTFAEVTPGIYSLIADADGYIAAQTVQFSIGGNDSAVFATVVLIAGDVIDDDVIDLLDITQFAADYTGVATSSVDFDRNATLDLRDFSFMVNNLDVVGPIDWN